MMILPDAMDGLAGQIESVFLCDEMTLCKHYYKDLLQQGLGGAHLLYPVISSQYFNMK